jgi:hypothetical protein
MTESERPRCTCEKIVYARANPDCPVHGESRELSERGKTPAVSATGGPTAPLAESEQNEEYLRETRAAERDRAELAEAEVDQLCQQIENDLQDRDRWKVRAELAESTLIELAEELEAAQNALWERRFKDCDRILESLRAKVKGK